MSEALGQMVRIKVSARGLKTIEHNGGIDAYLLTSSDLRLSIEARRLKRRIRRVLDGQQAAA